MTTEKNYEELKNIRDEMMSDLHYLNKLKSKVDSTIGDIQVDIEQANDILEKLGVGLYLDNDEECLHLAIKELSNILDEYQRTVAQHFVVQAVSFCQGDEVYVFTNELDAKKKADELGKKRNDKGEISFASISILASNN